MRETVGLFLAQPHLPHQGIDAFAAFSGRLTCVDDQWFVQNGCQRFARVQRGKRVLKHDLHTLAQQRVRLWIYASDVPPIHDQGTRRGLFNQGQQARQRGLATTRLAHHSQRATSA